MPHIDDWLDAPATGSADVKEWLEHFRRPAIDKDAQAKVTTRIEYRDGTYVESACDYRGPKQKQKTPNVKVTGSAPPPINRETRHERPRRKTEG